MRTFYKGSEPEKEPPPPEKTQTGRLKFQSALDAANAQLSPPTPARGTSATPTSGAPPPPLSKHELEVVAQDLVAAADFQRSLLPKELPQVPGYEFGVHYRGARPVSGDHYDFIEHPEGRLGVVIGDASGKGLTAALLITMVRALLHARGPEAVTPESVLSFVNAKLHPQIKRGMFVSMTYALLDPRTHVVQLANAGHLPTLVWRLRSRIVTVHPARGVVLGAGGPAIFDSRLQTEEVKLEVGDRLLLITDGVNEAMAPGQREFGMEHLRKRLQADSDRSSADFLKNIISQIDIHRAGGEQSDDITVVTFKRLS